MIYLDLEALLHIAPRTLGAEPAIRDIGLLSAAVARPRTTAFGEEAYPTLAGKAAALLHSIVRNRAVVDGNKRLGWAATVVFCDINGHFLELDDDTAYDLVIGVATGALDVPEITSIFDRHLGGA